MEVCDPEGSGHTHTRLTELDVTSGRRRRTEARGQNQQDPQSASGEGRAVVSVGQKGAVLSCCRAHAHPVAGY